MKPKFLKNTKFTNKHQILEDRQFSKNPKITNEPQTSKEHKISKEAQNMKESQILKEHKISKQTQIMNEPQFLNNCQSSKQTELTKKPQILKERQISNETQFTNAVKRRNMGDTLINELEVKDKTCCICMDEIKDRQRTGITKCKHIFHHSCIREWLTKKCSKPTCPNCRQDLRE